MAVKVLSIFGTRPEAIKMAPVMETLQKRVELSVCITGQHREMLDQVLTLFGLKADYDLSVMRPGQDLFDVTSAVLLGLRDVIGQTKPDMLVIHGDTTTSFAGALAGFYSGVPIAHVEAGLRTYDLSSPYPEEFNRQLNSKLCSLHFAPTKKAKDNLIYEHVNQEDIFVTGNTVIDALMQMKKRAEKTDYSYELKNLLPFLVDGRASKMILITGHRRENFGRGLESICRALKRIAEGRPDVNLIYPMHLNPNVREPVENILGDIANVYLIEPLDYLMFTKLMVDSYFLLTDSGGIQEEAPSLGKPVLVMRENSERPEAVEAGTAKIVGVTEDEIVASALNLLDNKELYSEMSNAKNPYGDGHASDRISNVIVRRGV